MQQFLQDRGELAPETTTLKGQVTTMSTWVPMFRIRDWTLSLTTIQEGCLFPSHQNLLFKEIIFFSEMLKEFSSWNIFGKVIDAPQPSLTLGSVANNVWKTKLIIILQFPHCCHCIIHFTQSAKLRLWVAAYIIAQTAICTNCTLCKVQLATCSTLQFAHCTFCTLRKVHKPVGSSSAAKRAHKSTISASPASISCQ